jgi:hypothetical protein
MGGWRSPVTRTFDGIDSHGVIHTATITDDRMPTDRECDVTCSRGFSVGPSTHVTLSDLETHFVDVGAAPQQPLR